MARMLLAAAAIPALFACSQPESATPPPAREAPAERPASDPNLADRSQPPARGEEPRSGDPAPAEPDEEPQNGDGAGSAPDVPPPNNALPDDAGTIERAYLIGPWTARGGDCARPDFDISDVPGAERPSIETSLDGAPRTGAVRTGADAAFVFDQPETVFPLEKRRAEGLAVLPPESGAVELGGRMIEGDGVVFIKCAQDAGAPD